jgi:hypothetical protein
MPGTRAALPDTLRGLSLYLLLAACSSHEAPPAQPQDQTLQRYRQAGELAYSLDRPQEAVTQYRLALTQAEARDDLTAIGNLSFNLVVAQLRANQPADALATARRARAELARRGGSAFPALDLAEATALYRTGDATSAASMAARLQNGSDRETATAASFLRGLIADERHDKAGLQAAEQALRQTMAAALAASPPPAIQPQDQPGAGALRPETQADAAELQARLARQNGNFAQARAAALQSADLRRGLLDYRGLARALSVAADAARQAGDPSAADLYLRAGRSAAAQGDPATARPWLEQAIRLSHDPAITEAANKALSDMAESGAN